MLSSEGASNASGDFHLAFERSVEAASAVAGSSSPRYTRYPENALSGSPPDVRAGAVQLSSIADSVTRACKKAIASGTGNMRTETAFELAEARFLEARVRTT